MDPCEHNDVTDAVTITDSIMTNGTPLSGPHAEAISTQTPEASDDAVVLVAAIIRRRVDNCPDHVPNCPSCGVR